MSNDQANKLELEQILSAIKYDQKISQVDCNNHEFTPYLFPLERDKDGFAGRFGISGKNADKLVSFSFLRDGLVDYYHFSSDLTLEKAEKQDCQRIYLPLAKTEYKSIVGINENGQFLPHDGSPFHLAGIEGAEEPYPLVLVGQTADGIVAQGLYFQKSNILTNFNLNGLDKVKLQHFLWKAAYGGRTGKNFDSALVDFFDPQAIIRYLDRFIVGQDIAKEMVAVSFSNYMVRMANVDEGIDINHMLFIGPSGVGKTTMMRYLAKAAKIPCVSEKLSGKCTEGFRGQRLSPLFKKFREQSNEEAPYGIVFLDELDKLAQDEKWYGPRLMEELIGYIDDTTVRDRGDSNNKEEQFEISTSNLLFVTAGAFLGSQQKKSLSQLIRERLMNDAKTSVIPSNDDLLAQAEPLDLIRYGIKSELAGRLQVVVPFHSLNEKERVKILSESELSPLHSYARLLEARGYVLKTDGLAEVIAKSSSKETNARALQSACHKLFYKIILNPTAFADEEKIISLDDLTLRRLLKNGSLRK